VTEASPHAGLAVAAAGGGLTLLAAAIGRRNLHLPALREQPFARVHSM
jgi:hypothetical protein